MVIQAVHVFDLDSRSTYQLILSAALGVMWMESSTQGSQELQGLVEPVNFVVDQGLLMTKALVDPRNPEITLSVLNLGKKGVNLSVNTVLGALHTVKEIYSVGESGSPEGFPEHLDSW